MALQTNTMEGYSGFHQPHGEVIESGGLGLALQFNSVVIEIKQRIGVGTVGIDKGGIDIVVANGTLPYCGTQVVAIRVGAYAGLVVVKTFVDNVPLNNLSLEVIHHLVDMVPQQFERLGARPVLVVLLTVA